MKCAKGEKCQHKPKCVDACNLRVQPVIDILAAQDDAARPMLESIGRQIGYGNAQHILGQLWDQMLHDSYGVPPGRGGMGVTTTEAAAYQRGWEACMEQWAKHMTRMAKAVKKETP